jgi:hypothetical protein
MRGSSLLIYLFTLITLFTSQAVGQTYEKGFVPLTEDINYLLQPALNKVGSPVHTSMMPLMWKDVSAVANPDSLLDRPVNDSKFSRSLFGRKLYSEHLFQVQQDDYFLFLDPAFELAAGTDQEYNRNIYTNTRGFRAGGYIGKRFSFLTTFYENQSQFAYYLDSSIARTRIVPGQGRVKQNGEVFDYAFATGTLNFELNKHFTFQFGNDKNFIGDGYRSLLLSDNAFNYPSFKIITDVWKIRYTNMFVVMQDLSNDDPTDDFPFLKKYGSFHYLDFNIGKHASIGVFEAVIWQMDTVGNRGFDLGYMNPFIFFRPVEFSIGSPDNVLLGLNAKVKLNSKNLLYGQIMLDEFLLAEVRAGNGWWANKQGIQAGFKSFDVFGVKNLQVQGEMNYVRPYTYQHRTPQGNYGHYRSALAHPLGANFTEFVGIARYKYNNFEFRAKMSYAEVGYDTAGVNFGQDIFKSYVTHPYEYGNEVGQGLKTKVTWLQFTADYLLNRKNRMSVFVDASVRNISNSRTDASTLILQGGLRTRLFNRYYDF